MPEGRDLYRDGNARADRSYNYVSAGTEGQEFPDSWSTDDPNRFVIPASKVHGNIGRDQIMIDASSTGGGETDSHIINFTTNEASIKELKRGRWTAEGKRQHVGPKKGQVHWNMYPESMKSGGKYVDESTEGMWEGVGQVVSGAANIAFDPLVIAGAVGYQVGKKGLLDKIGRGKKGPPDDRRLPPDDPFRD